MKERDKTRVDHTVLDLGLIVTLPRETEEDVGTLPVPVGAPSVMEAGIGGTRTLGKPPTITLVGTRRATAKAAAVAVVITEENKAALNPRTPGNEHHPKSKISRIKIKENMTSPL